MDTKLITPFVESAKAIINDMTGIAITNVGDFISAQSDFSSLGVASVITFSGKIKGRFILDLSPALALTMANRMTGESNTSIKDKLFLAGISEMNNIIAGDANTYLNNIYGLSLRLAPPIVFSGKNMMIAASKLESVSVDCGTSFGELKLNIAFQGGIAS